MGERSKLFNHQFSLVLSFGDHRRWAWTFCFAPFNCASMSCQHLEVIGALVSTSSRSMGARTSATVWSFSSSHWCRTLCWLCRGLSFSSHFGIDDRHFLCVHDFEFLTKGKTHSLEQKQLRKYKIDCLINMFKKNC